MTMTNDTMQRYVDFICGELPEYKSVLLYRPDVLNGQSASYIPKIGPKIYERVKIEIVEKYTRSAKIKITFDNYSDESIYYMSRHKGPDILLSEINSKIEKIVNRIFIENDRKEEILKRYENYKIDLSGLMDKQFFTKDPN